VIDRDSDSLRVRITNLDGKAYCHTGRAALQYRRSAGFSFELEYIFKDKQITYDGALRSEALLPQHRFMAGAAYRFSGKENDERFWEIGISGNLLGKQRLPLNGGSAQAFAPGYGLLNARIEKALDRWFFFLHADNLLDYRMPQPVISAENTASPLFEASQQWAPVAGRIFRLGVSWKWLK